MSSGKYRPRPDTKDSCWVTGLRGVWAELIPSVTFPSPLTPVDLQGASGPSRLSLEGVPSFSRPLSGYQTTGGSSASELEEMPKEATSLSLVPLGDSSP